MRGVTVGRRRTRLNETALLIAEHLERRDEQGDLEVYVIDAELAAERLADTARYLVVTSGRPPDALRCPLLAALRSLGAATATGTAPARVPALLEAAQRRVAPLVDRVEGLGDDGQRVAFAVARFGGRARGGPQAPPDRPRRRTVRARPRRVDRHDSDRHRGQRRRGDRPRGRHRRRDVTGGPATGDGPPSPTARPSSRGSRSRRGRPSRSGWPRAWPSSAAS